VWEIEPCLDQVQPPGVFSDPIPILKRLFCVGVNFPKLTQNPYARIAFFALAAIGSASLAALKGSASHTCYFHLHPSRHNAKTRLRRQICCWAIGV